MLCISGAALVAFCVLALASVGGLGISSYVFLSGLAQKQHAELLFFCALTAAIVLALLFVLMVLRAHRLTRDLRHTLGKVRSGGRLEDGHFRAFGSFGLGIMSVIREMQDVSDKRAQRIKFLNNALVALMAETGEALLLLDSEGGIVQASLEFFGKFTKPEEQGAVYGSNIERFIGEDITFPALAQEMGRTRTDRTVTTEKYVVQFFPIFTNAAQADGFIAVMQRRTIADDIGNLGKKVVGNVTGLFARKEDGAGDDGDGAAVPPKAKKQGAGKPQAAGGASGGTGGGFSGLFKGARGLFGRKKDAGAAATDAAAPGPLPAGGDTAGTAGSAAGAPEAPAGGSGT